MIASDWKLGGAIKTMEVGAYFSFLVSKVAPHQLLNERICAQQYREESASGNQAGFVLLY